MIQQTLRLKLATVFVAMFALIIASMLAVPASAGEKTADVKQIGSAEFKEYKPASDEYKFTVEPTDDGSATINVEPGTGQTLEVRANGDLDFLSKDGKKVYQLSNLSAVTDKYPEAKVGEWTLTDNGASVKITAPPKVQAEFEKSPSCDDSSNAEADSSRSVDAHSAYSDCMLASGVKQGVAGAVVGCVGGAWAAGVGCVAGILPGATTGYVAGIVTALWDCKDKL